MNFGFLPCPLRAGPFFMSILLIGIGIEAKAQEDSTIIKRIMENVGYFEWDADIYEHVRLLQEWGIDTCRVIGIDRPITVGPSTRCDLENISLGMGYQWDKAGIPILAFFNIHFVDCETCSLSFRYLIQVGYETRKNAEPSEVETLSRYFIKRDGIDTVRIDVWNECCPGNRIKIFRVLNSPTKRKKQGLDQDTAAGEAERKKAAAKKY